MSWEASNPSDAAVAAFVLALASLDEVTKSRDASIETRGGGGYTYSYADLSDVIESSRAKLAAQGLAVSQTATAGDGYVEVWTTLWHTSGQWVRFAPMRLPCANDPRAAGSAITYARRYALMAVLGIATEDDDAASAGKPERARSTGSRPAQSTQTRRGPQGARQPAPPATEAMGKIRAALVGQSDAVARRVRGEARKRFGMGLGDLPADQHEAALEFVENLLSEIEHETEAQRSEGEGYG